MSFFVSNFRHNNCTSSQAECHLSLEKTHDNINVIDI